MEIPYGFRESFMEGDKSLNYYVARALLKFQSLYGFPEHIRYCGQDAQQVYSLLSEFKGRLGSSLGSFNPEYHEIILLDRSVDLVSPLMTQHTYEGLIDELYGVQNNLLNLDFLKDYKLPTGLFQDKKDDKKDAKAKEQPPADDKQPQQPPEQQRARKMALNDDDTTYAAARHLHFLAVGEELGKIAKEIDAKYENRKNLTDVAEIKEYFYQLPALTQRHEDLTVHVNIATEIKKETIKTEFKKWLETEQSMSLLSLI